MKVISPDCGGERGRLPQRDLKSHRTTPPQPERFNCINLIGNYRGISILVALAKLYDMVLSYRFQLWYKPKFEQAGAQRGRECEEQILTTLDRHSTQVQIGTLGCIRRLQESLRYGWQKNPPPTPR